MNVDVYPVGLLRDVLQAYRRRSMRRPDWWFPLRSAERSTMRAVRARDAHGLKCIFNGYIAEPQEWPRGLRRCGTGWTPDRARRDLDRRMAAVQRSARPGGCGITTITGETMKATSRTSIRLGLGTEATLSDLREMLAEADRLGAPDDARVTYRATPATIGGLIPKSMALLIEWTPEPVADESVHESGAACPCEAEAPPEPVDRLSTDELSFNVDTVEEPLGQLIGACSATRFWDEMSPQYPSGAGVFQDAAGRRLLEAARAAYAKIGAWS